MSQIPPDSDADAHSNVSAPTLASRTSLWRNRPFNIFLIGQGLSNIGDAFALISLPWVVFETTHSILKMGVIAALFAIGQFISSLISGVLVDRLDRRKLMIACDIGHALLYGSVPLVWWQFGPQINYLYFVAITGGALTACFLISHTTVVPDLVAPNHITEANGRLQMTTGLALMIGPGLAGLVSAGFGPVAALGLNGVSFLFSMLSLMLIRLRPHVRADADQLGSGIHARWLEWSEGIRFLFSDARLKAVVVLSLLYLTITSSAINLFLFYLKDHLHQSDANAGFIFSIASIGAVLAGLFTSKIQARIGFGACFIGSLLFSGICFTIIGNMQTVLQFAPFTVLYALFDTMRMICSVSLRQHLVPRALLGRTGAAFNAMLIIPFSVGSLLNSAIAERFGITHTVIGMGVLLICLAICGMFSAANLRGSIEHTAASRGKR